MIWITAYDANIYYKKYVVVPKSAKSHQESDSLRLKQCDFPFMLQKSKKQQTQSECTLKNTQKAALHQLSENKQSNNILGLT